jgi:ATP-dependent RNA helicase DDX49/DBP8
MEDSFEKMKLEKWILKIIKYLSYKEPTEVQKYVIPQILKDKSVIAISKTGTGKTASFCLPILSELSKNPFGLYSIILEPTRELVLQVEEKLKLFSTGFNLRMCSIIGGEDYTTQLKELDKIPHIIIATPGRLVSFLENNYIKLVDNLRYFVMDEFDQLLDDTIKPDIDKIITYLPDDRITLFFSATIMQTKEELKKYLGKNDKDEIFYYNNNTDEKIDDIIKDTNINKEKNKDNDKDDKDKEIKKKNKIIPLKIKNRINEDISLKYILVPQKLKEHYLLYLLRNRYKETNTLIFVNHVKQCDFLYNLCKLFEIKVSHLHSKMTQKNRREDLQKFKGSMTNILISTDLASRGLDIKQCDLVINFDIPLSSLTFIHRAGRTGRIGNKGLCISLVSQYDVEVLNGIEEDLNADFKEIEDIDQDEIMVDTGLVSKGIKLTKMKMIKEEKSK